MTNLTYSKALEIAIAEIADPAVKEKLTALKGQVDKKASAERKPTKTQLENMGYKSAIVDALDSTPRTISEIMDLVPELAELSNQRISAMLTALCKAENPQVVRSEFKGKARFARIA